MKATPAQKKEKTVDVPLREVERLFGMSMKLTDLAEEILEQTGQYKPEFIRGLNRSLKEEKLGKLKTIQSLDELL